jgi:transcriptional regulator with XRE-family HTH domain
MPDTPIGKNLKKLRLERNLSQKELGKRLSVEDSTISNWERGIRQVDSEMIQKIATVFGVPIDTLYGTNPADTTYRPGFRYIKCYDLSKMSKQSDILLILFLMLFAFLSMILYRDGNKSAFFMHTLFWIFYFLYFPIHFYRRKQASTKRFNVDFNATCRFQTDMSEKSRHNFHIESIGYVLLTMVLSFFTYGLSYIVFTATTSDPFFRYFFILWMIMVFGIALWMLISLILKGIPTKTSDYDNTIVSWGLFKYRLLWVIQTFNHVVVYTFIIFYGINFFNHGLLWLVLILTPFLAIFACVMHQKNVSFYDTYELKIE